MLQKKWNQFFKKKQKLLPGLIFNFEKVLKLLFHFHVSVIALGE